MNNKSVLIIQPLMEKLDIMLTERFDCHRLYEYENLDAYLAHHGNGVSAIVTRGDVGVASSIMERLPQLAAIAVFGVGTDRIDLNYTRSRNIGVSITKDILTDDVADLALTLLLASSRNLVAYHQFAASGEWQQNGPALSTSVTGKKVGILGLGKIGQAIAHRAAAFGMQVGYSSRMPKEVPYLYHSHPIELAAWSDFLVLALPGSVENQHIIDQRTLQALGKDGVLINIARGNVVDQDALISALEQGVIKGAALDVYAEEPTIPEQLRKLPNVVLTPHIASATHETRQRMAGNVVNNLESFFSSGTLLTAV